MVWEIWQDRGYCALGESICAYVDFTPTPCGAIRCTGPFSTTSIHPDQMQSSMRSLTITLESLYLPSNQFVLWGAYHDFPQYREHEMKILGTVCGHIPAPWLRTYLLGYDQDSLAREWTSTSSKVVHRSGIQFPNVAHSVADPTLFHPSNAEESIAELRNHSNQINQSNQIISPEIENTIPHLRWSLSDRRQSIFAKKK